MCNGQAANGKPQMIVFVQRWSNKIQVFLLEKDKTIMSIVRQLKEL